MGFSRQEYWSGFPLLSLGDLPDLNPSLWHLPALAGGFFTTSATWAHGSLHPCPTAPGKFLSHTLCMWTTSLILKISRKGRATIFLNNLILLYSTKCLLVLSRKQEEKWSMETRVPVSAPSPTTDYLATLYLTFLLCKISIPHWGLSEEISVKHLAHSKHYINVSCCYYFY